MWHGLPARVHVRSQAPGVQCGNAKCLPKGIPSHLEIRFWKNRGTYTNYDSSATRVKDALS